MAWTALASTSGGVIESNTPEIQIVLDSGHFRPRMRALMNSNYQHSFACRAFNAMPQASILSNRPGVYACALVGERDDDLN